MKKRENPTLISMASTVKREEREEEDEDEEEIAIR
jgi:hypothetical protein